MKQLLLLLLLISGCSKYLFIPIEVDKFINSEGEYFGENRRYDFFDTLKVYIAREKKPSIWRFHKYMDWRSKRDTLIGHILCPYYLEGFDQTSHYFDSIYGKRLNYIKQNMGLRKKYHYGKYRDSLFTIYDENLENPLTGTKQFRYEPYEVKGTVDTSKFTIIDSAYICFSNSIYLLNDGRVQCR